MAYSDPHANYRQEPPKPKKWGKRIGIGVAGFFGLLILGGLLDPAESDTADPAPTAQADKTAGPSPTVQQAATEDATEQPNPEPTGEPTTETPEPTEEPEPDFDAAAATAELEDTIRESIGGQDIEDFCDPAYTKWFCYFDHYEVTREGWISIYLGFPGDVNQNELAQDAREWTASMLWDHLPELDTIVSYDSNGLDLGTTRR